MNQQTCCVTKRHDQNDQNHGLGAEDHPGISAIPRAQHDTRIANEGNVHLELQGADVQNCCFFFFFLCKE